MRCDRRRADSDVCRDEATLRPVARRGGRVDGRPESALASPVGSRPCLHEPRRGVGRARPRQRDPVAYVHVGPSRTVDHAGAQMSIVSTEKFTELQGQYLAFIYALQRHQPPTASGGRLPRILRRHAADRAPNGGRARTPRANPANAAPGSQHRIVRCGRGDSPSAAAIDRLLCAAVLAEPFSHEPSRNSQLLAVQWARRYSHTGMRA